MDIKIVDGLSKSEEVAELFREYTDMLVSGDSSFSEYLGIQHFDSELRNLAEKYGPPGGRLYVALCDNLPAGCIGIRRLDSERCEMKRLYVRPGYRGSGLGKTLVKMVIDDAREMGYSYMLLDTLPFLKRALHLYEEFGFSKIDRYNDSPMDSSIYMRLDLNA